MEIRRAVPADWSQIWPIFHTIVAAGDTYAYNPATTAAEARRIWMEKPLRTYVALANDSVLGTYFLTPNQPYLGSHVCNCGYMVAPAARGQGVATAMCRHSQVEARALGFRAMQFNLVVATNAGAIKLWRRHGFDIVGRLPGAFHHQQRGYVDALVMFKSLVDAPR
jgi:L-amino acid N-acyltransferase YncA